MNIGTLLADLARTRPQQIALIDARPHARHPRLTFAELEGEVSRAAGWLRSHGLVRGDAALVFVPLSAELYVGLLALFRLGVTAVFVDPAAGRDYLERCCLRCSPKAFLGVPKAHLLRLRSAALRAIPLKFVLGGLWLPGAHPWSRSGQAEACTENFASTDDPALITFTSGSTGVPKAAVRTHGFLIAQYEALRPNIALEPGEVDLATLPVFTLANLAGGLTTVISAADLRRPGAIDASVVFGEVGKFGVGRITASPAFFERLIEHGLERRLTLPSLRKIHTGGAPVFPRLLKRLGHLAPAAAVVAVYGSTEAEPIAHLSADEIITDDMAAMLAGKGLLAGRPVPEIRVRILRDRWGMPRQPLSAAELEGETLGVEQPGEIVVAGAHVLSGYLAGVGDEETKFRCEGEVWHRTGDAGRFDSQGRLWLLGRCAARIEDARGTLYPFAVECVAMQFAAVRRAALLGLNGRRLLILEMSDDGGEVSRSIAESARWAQLDRIERCDELPVDARHNAKIDYVALRKRYS